MFQMILQYIAVFTVLGGVFVQCQVPQTGRCPNNIEVKSDFQAEKYLGRWYEYAKYPFIFEAGGICITADYGDLGNGKISVVNSQSGFISKIKGKAVEVEPGKLLVNFDFAPLDGFPGTNYWVLDTDYENYAVVYSCFDLGFFHTKVVWILTRERKPSSDFIKKAKSVIRKNELSLDLLTITDQKNCVS